jgi:glycosyltransferase involved in cell wall biosynthesis
LAESPIQAGGQPALGPRWRAEAERVQEAALPPGRVVVSCPARLGGGGLGRHLQEIVGALDRRGQPRECICDDQAPRHGGPPLASPATAAAAAAVRLTRFSPSWRMWAVGSRFDAEAARRLPPADHLVAFNGRAALQFAAAARMGYASCSLVSANSHLRRVLRQHALAQREYPLERSWATHFLRRNLAEYERADRIYVASAYIRDSFLEEGFSEDALAPFPLTPDPRFTREARAPASNTFDIVYVGSLTVAKGVPLLIDAVGRLSHADLRLVLVGGWSSRGMRRFIGEACVRDGRIVVRPGDPLRCLRVAGVCVHPSYEEGFAYAPAEALACGVPLIVTEDTGMKELIQPGRTGVILSTGDGRALADAIDAAYRGELLSA